MKDLAIYGAGGLGREVAVLADTINRRASEPEFRLVGFFDDGKAVGEEVSHFGKTLGGYEVLNNWQTPLSVCLAFGSPAAIKAVRRKIVNPLVNFPNLIHPDSWFMDLKTLKMGEGNIIQGACVATTDFTLGNFNVLNGYVVFGHDCTVGDYNVFMPGSRISGEVTIGEGNLFGAGSFVLQQLKIGNGVRLAPLSPLLTHPRDGHTYMGNPAKMMKY